MIKPNYITELAYTAGIIDGEGTIALSKYNCKGMKLGYQTILRVQVGNTNEWLIRWLQFTYGGSIWKTAKNNISNKDCWTWGLVARQALTFLKVILPYLKIKHPQAKLAIQFQTAKKNWGRTHKAEEQIAVEEARVILMGKFNQKGKEVKA